MPLEFPPELQLRDGPVSLPVAGEAELGGTRLAPSHNPSSLHGLSPGAGRLPLPCWRRTLTSDTCLV